MQSRSSAASPDEDPVRSWWSLDRSSSALSHPVAALSTAHQARGIASDVLCRSHPNRPSSRLGQGLAARFHLHRRFVKSDGLLKTRTPSLDECCLLRFGLRRTHLIELGFRLAMRGARDLRQLATGPWCLHREPASSILSPSEHKAGWLDLCVSTLRPDAARQFLQPEQSTSTTRETV